ncbi:MAG TPA: XrtA/PEP-CTERM system histidine kinase PrsK [Casimicrobiaceae bacterium]
MTATSFAAITAWSYGIALVGYVAFAARVAPDFRRSARARLLLTALLATVAWAAFCLLTGITTSPNMLLAANVADALRYAAWFAFLASLLRSVSGTDDSAGAPSSGTLVVVVAVAATLIAGVLLSEGSPLRQFAWLPAARADYLLHLGIAVFGLMLLEHVMRRVQPQTRWGIKPLAVALAGVFGLDLFFYADAMLFGQLDAVIWVSRGLANAIVIPFLAIATARNTGWTVDLHLSRGAVFHSSALLVSGAFLLVVAGAGYFVRYFGGDWGRALQIELLFAAMLFVVVVGTSGRFRARLKVFVSKHFFSYRYDYREEWLRFTRTLSMDGSAQSVQERSIMALADLVESPCGALWLKDESRGYVPAARWNLPAMHAAEPADGALATFLARTGWVVDVAELRDRPARYDGLALPEWLASFPSAWIIVPLLSGSDLLGMVVLATPRTKVELDWEVRDLLKTASRQAASYVSQMRATEALLEARKFDAFNRMSAFVVHDLKNLVAQLSLMLKNAERHRANPEFQADMLTTVAHVVGRMNALMLQLRVGATPVDSPRPIDLDAVVRRVCGAKADSATPIGLELASGVVALGHEDRLEHVIGHLVQNAIDASTSARQVTVFLAREGREAVLVVADNGEGMTREFIQERLFKPFQTTKPAGMGIGVYESSQYVTKLGGEITVASELGAGTRVTVRLPLVDVDERPALSVSEEAA